jgi:hypothetical protein
MTTLLDTPTSKFLALGRLVGNTPMVTIQYHYRGCDRLVYAKSEYLSLTGRVKDRMALRILQQAYTEGKIEPGFTIAEATSGNTEIAFAALGRMLGHPAKNLHARLDEPGTRVTDQELLLGNRVGQPKGWRVPGQHPNVRGICSVAQGRVSTAAIFERRECGCARRDHRSGNLVATDERCKEARDICVRRWNRPDGDGRGQVSPRA